MAKRQCGPVDLMVANAELRDVMSDIVRVDLSHRPFAKAGRVIVICSGGKCIRAVARGPAKVGKTGIALDSAARQALGVQVNRNASFTFKEASMWDDFLWAWSATDAMPRIAARLGLISVAAGVIGLFLGLISLCS